MEKEKESRKEQLDSVLRKMWAEVKQEIKGKEPKEDTGD